MSNEASFQKFISDPQLAKLIDIFKKTDNIFEIIDHGENQHSEILKWLFDPREGHGQGDAIFKDFLIAAYWAAKDNVHSNKDFFEIWTPSKIARSGFNSIVLYREFMLPSKRRLDLILADFDNKIIVVIENKRGANLGDEQIKSYYEEVSREIRNRPVFKGFSTAHVVLDQYHNFEGECSDTDPRNRWAFLDYQWLKASARRAEFQLKRGNISSALVISYCQSQCDYVSEEEKETDAILAKLANDYRELMQEFASISSMDLINLKPSELNQIRGEMWLFAQHYSDLVERISEKTHLSYIESRLQEEFPKDKIDSRFSRSRLVIQNVEWNRLMSVDAEFLPIIVNIRQKNNSKDGSKFNVSINYMRSMLAGNQVEKINAVMEALYPALRKGQQNANTRQLNMQKNLTQIEAVKAAIAAFRELNNGLHEVLS